MRKLTPIEIGRLAIHVEKAIRENPVTEEEWDAPIDPMNPVEFDYEIQLKKDINEDPLLPSYEEIDTEDEVIDFLLGYFSREEGLSGPEMDELLSDEDRDEIEKEMNRIAADIEERAKKNQKKRRR